MLGSYYNEKLSIQHLYITKEIFFFGPRLPKNADFQIEPFEFRLVDEQEFEHYPDYSSYEITYESATSFWNCLCRCVNKLWI